MKAASDARVLILAIVTGVVGFCLLAFLVKVPEPHLQEAGKAAPSVGLLDPVFVKATLLSDPTPLFLPTQFNSSRRDYVAKEPGGAFSGFPPKLSFGESELSLRLPAPSVVPTSPAEALAGDPPGEPFLAFGRKDPVMQPLSARTAYVEIRSSGTGTKVFAQALGDAHPPARSMPWQPMEFIAAVDAAGLVGPLVPTRRSGVDDVDAYFGRYLAETLKVGQRLAPGFYRIVVGP
jgi:hypothetical protein